MSEAVHITGPDGRTYCGRQSDRTVPEGDARAILANKYELCGTCDRRAKGA